MVGDACIRDKHIPEDEQAWLMRKCVSCWKQLAAEQRAEDEASKRMWMSRWRDGAKIQAKDTWTTNGLTALHRNLLMKNFKKLVESILYEGRSQLKSQRCSHAMTMFRMRMHVATWLKQHQYRMSQVRKLEGQAREMQVQYDALPRDKPQSFDDGVIGGKLRNVRLAMCVQRFMRVDLWAALTKLRELREWRAQCVNLVMCHLVQTRQGEIKHAWQRFQEEASNQRAARKPMMAAEMWMWRHELIQSGELWNMG